MRKIIKKFFIMLYYGIFDIIINFERTVFFKTYPVIIIRSVFGKELHRLVCIFKNRRCNECSLPNTCVYGKYFETILEKDSENSQEKGSHPFVLYTAVQDNSKVDKLELKFVLIGDAIEYFPYFYYSFKKAGEIGILKERIKFYINDVKINGKSIIKGNDLILDFEKNLFRLNNDQRNKINKKFKVNLLTPFRYKKDGKYVDDFNSIDFFKTIYRRLNNLINLYGKKCEIQSYEENNEIEIKNKNLFWKEYKYYSSRQKELLKLGGVMGKMELEGNFTPFELSLLEFAKLFNIGKNISFGLGKLDYFVIE